MQPSTIKVNVSHSGKFFCQLLFMRFFWKNLVMEKILGLFLFTSLATGVFAQQDTSLVKRLNATLQFTKQMELEKVMDLTYPKLFGLASREQMLDALKRTFENDEFKTELDSLKIDTIFPVFTIEKGSYTKVKHTMLMRMLYKEPFDTSGTGIGMMIGLMEARFGKGNVRFDHAKNSLNIRMHVAMIAIKDDVSPQWTFVNFDESNPLMLDMLFSKEVLAKLKELK